MKGGYLLCHVVQTSSVATITTGAYGLYSSSSLFVAAVTEALTAVAATTNRLQA